MAQPHEDSPKHVPELDGIRGLAILGVLCSHGADLAGLFDNANSWPDTVIRYTMVPLWGGVDLFFALSGFLITGILLRTKNSANYFSAFYARRALRIFPIYFLVLTLTLVAGHFSVLLEDQLPHWISWKAAYFVYLPNWPIFWHGQKSMEGLWGSYWSLAVEEQFYFVWPFLIFLLRQEVVAWICYLGIICALPLRIVLSHLYFGNSIGLAQITSSRVDGLLIGAASAIYLFRHKRPIPMPWILGFATGGGAIMGYIIAFHREELVNTGKGTSLCTWGITGFALLSGALIGISQHRIWWIQRLLTVKWLRAVGKYSYGMYVYHLFIFIPIRYLGNRVGLWLRLNFVERFCSFVLEAMLVFLIAKLSYDLLESRFLRLKSYFEPRKNVAVPVAALASEQ